MKKYNSFRPGKIWLDTNGKRIQAHGGSVMFWNDAYYWYGENKEFTDPEKNIWHWGVRCYRSDDLYNWEDLGLIIPPNTEDKNSSLHPSACMDRPHIKDKIFMDRNELEKEGPITIVVFGDSITHGALLNEINYETVYWNLLRKKILNVRNYVPVNIINAGIGGVSAKDSLSRIDKQVLAHSPDLVIVCFGLNDVNGTLEDYLSSLRIIYMDMSNKENFLKECRIMINGKNKFITFSYDDGVTQDKQLIEIFNKYNLKATFNINSELLGQPGSLVLNGVHINHTKNNPEDVKYIYAGHEVAVHTLTHPNLVNIEDDKEVLRQVEQDRVNLSELVGYEVEGMAYPCGGKNCDARVADIIKNNTIIKYARTIDTTKSFEPFDDLYQYKGTLYHHEDWDILFDMGKKFLELQTDTPKIFYIWGHAYEFDIYPERWNMFDEFCKMMSNRSDIFYGTNKEVLSVI